MRGFQFELFSRNKCARMIGAIQRGAAQVQEKRGAQRRSTLFFSYSSRKGECN